jgi:autotransporter-associated beta strand protein
MSTRFYPGQTDYIVQLNLMDDALNAAGLGGNFTTTTLSIKDGSDTTKELKFNVAGFTTGTTRTFTFPNSNATVAGLEVAQTFTNTQGITHTNPTLLSLTRSGNAANANMNFVTTSGSVFIGQGTANSFAIGNSNNLTTGQWFTQSATAATTIGNFTIGGFLLRSVATGISAAGTNQGSAFILTKDLNVVSTVTAGTGVILPGAQGAGLSGVVVHNAGANPLNVYPPVGGTINSLGLNAALVIPAGENRTFFTSSTTQWYTLSGTGAGGGSGDVTLAGAQTFTGAKTFNAGTLLLAGATSGSMTLAAPATASGTVTFPTSGTVVIDGQAHTTTAPAAGDNSNKVPDTAWVNTAIGNRAFAGSGAPASSLGSVGAYYIRTDAPFDGVLYYKSGASTWTIVSGPVATLADLHTTYPASATYEGCWVRVNEYRMDFECVNLSGTYYWVPMARRLALINNYTATSAGAGNGTTFQNIAALGFTIPAKIIVPGCRVRFELAVSYTGTSPTDTRAMRIRHAATASAVLECNSTATTQNTTLVRTQNEIKFRSSTQALIMHWSDSDGFTQNWGVSTPTLTYDIANAHAFEVGLVSTPSTSSATVEAREVEIFYPQ